MIGLVEECGCIALPEAVREQTGLYPGATYEIEIASDGAALVVRPIETRQPTDPNPGAHCG